MPITFLAAVVFTLMSSLAVQSSIESTRSAPPDTEWDMSRALSKLIREQKAKHHIKRMLNLNETAINSTIKLSDVPKPTPSAPTPTALTSWPQQVFTSSKKTKTLAILANTSGSKARNAVEFNLDQHIDTAVENIEDIHLMVYLSNDNIRPKTTKRTRDFQRRRRQRTRRNYRKRLTTSKMLKALKRGHNTKPHSVSRPKRINSLRKRKKLSRLNKQTKSMRKPGTDKYGNDKIKIAAFTARTLQGRRQRIARQIVYVQRGRKTLAKIRLPNNIISQGPKSVNNTLTIDIFCRRCGRKIHIEPVLKHAWLNPYRPYIQIKWNKKYKQAAVEPRSKSRRKRSQKKLARTSNRIRPTYHFRNDPQLLEIINLIKLTGLEFQQDKSSEKQ